MKGFKYNLKDKIDTKPSIAFTGGNVKALFILIILTNTFSLFGQQNSLKREIAREKGIKEVFIHKTFYKGIDSSWSYSHELYDKNGYCLFIEDSDKYTKYKVYHFAYDSIGNILSTRLTSHLGSTDVNSYKYIYSNDKLIENIISDSFSYQNKVDFIDSFLVIKYKYDSLGNLIEKDFIPREKHPEKRMSLSGVWKFTILSIDYVNYVFFFTYNSKGYMTKQIEHYYWRRGVFTSAETDYSYNSFGDTTLNKYFSDKYNETVEFNYNDSLKLVEKNITKMVEDTVEGTTNKIPKKESTYSYFNNGLIKEVNTVQFKMNDDGIPEIEGRVKTVYNYKYW
jgi:hypothetical protein